MSDQIDLRKQGPSRAIPRLEWHGWTTDTVFGWLEQKIRVSPQVEIGDITEGERKYPTAEAAVAAMQRAIAKKLAEGFEYEGEPPPPPPPKPSKPWPKGKAKAPAWLKQVDKKLVANLRRAIADAKLAHRGADIESLARPAIRLALKTVKPAAIAKGVVTRFGGDPDVPKAFAWPRSGKTPLAFVAQYRLDDLAAFDLEHALPKRGVLSLFAQLIPEDGYGEVAKAYYFPDAKRLARTAPAHGPEADGRPSKIAIATARTILTLPPPDHRAAGTLKLGDGERDAYHDGVWLATCGDDGPHHQLLGWPDMMTHHAFVAGWELLARIDSDDRCGLEMGDVETLRIHVATAKLAAKNVTAVRSTLAAE